VSLARLLKESVEVKPVGGVNAYGPFFGTPYTELCWAQRGFKRITNAQGQEIVVTLLLFFAPTTNAKTIGDEITYDSRRYEAVEVLPITVRGVLHHYEVYCRAWSG